MLRAHTKDGLTATFDLSNEEQARAWLRASSEADYQKTITGLTVVGRHASRGICPTCGGKCSSNMGVQISVSRPLHFRKIEMLAEQVPVEGNIKGGERLVVLCDNVRLGVMAHAEQPAVRITLARLALGEKV